MSLGPGTFVCVPPGVTHTFSNTSEAPVRFLNFNTPAGWENYMRELGEATTAGPPMPDVIGQTRLTTTFRPSERPGCPGPGYGGADRFRSTHHSAGPDPRRRT